MVAAKRNGTKARRREGVATHCAGGQNERRTQRKAPFLLRQLKLWCPAFFGGLPRRSVREWHDDGRRCMPWAAANRFVGILDIGIRDILADQMLSRFEYDVIDRKHTHQ